VEIDQMKKFALSLGAAAAVLALLAVTPGSRLMAQDSTAKTAAPAPAMQGPELPADFKPLFDGITLTDVQSRQIAGIARKYTAPAAGDSAKAGMGAGAVDRRMDAAKEFRTVLTPEQQKLFDKNLDRVKAAWGKKSY
jgi:Spy/CpxP family protein refolding chaperone